MLDNINMKNRLKFEKFEYKIVGTGFSNGVTGGILMNPGQKFDMVSCREMHQWIQDSQKACGFRFFTES